MRNHDRTEPPRAKSGSLPNRKTASLHDVVAGAVRQGPRAGRPAGRQGRRGAAGRERRRAWPQRLIAQGIDNVYLVDDPRLGHFQTLPYARVLCELIEKHQPQIVLYGATALGRDLAPRVASAMRAGMTADCTDLEINDVTDPKTKEVHKNLLLQIRPAFGGNIIATIVNYDRWPQMATVREGVMPLQEPDPVAAAAR